MNKIILVRHGETEWNKEEIFRGHADIDLNETGLKQAQLLAKYLKNEKIGAIYSSPLKRAIKTAEAIAALHNLNVIPCQELIDFNYGSWEGLPQKTVESKYQVLYEKWLGRPHLVKMPGGESLKDVRKRALGLVERTTLSDGGTVALVSHRVVHKVIICALLGLSNSHFWNIKLDTCGITVFSYSKGLFVLEKHNDTSFLAPLGRSELNDF